jgi:UDP-GlcNAc3NAcA epimerase
MTRKGNQARRTLLSMLKIMTILGARPQFIKAAVVSRAIGEYNLASQSGMIEELIIHTGQHFDLNMSDVFFSEMSIPKPSKHLNINQMSHGAMTGRMVEAIESLLIEISPDLVLVYGDTNSTLAGTLAAAKLHIPIAHVEAGLRSYNRRMPEEHNRVIADHLSSLLFCPTTTAVHNLEREGLSDYPATDSTKANHAIPPKIFLVGDVMYDASLYYYSQAKLRATVAKKVIEERLHGQRFALTTLHRQENTDNPVDFKAILAALINVSKNIPIVWPMHPRTRQVIEAQAVNTRLKRANIVVIDPVGYFDIIELLENCSIVLTDSGGLQKEAYFFKKPCVTLRSETEWVELVEHGCNRVVGSNSERILSAVNHMLDTELKFNQSLYGSGNAGQEIVAIIAEIFGLNDG